MERIQPRVIRKVSNEILEEIIKDEALKAVQACYQCGRCTGSCPSGRRTAIRTRQLMREALLGMDDVLRDPDLWLCTTCFTCFERCPRSVPVTEIILKLRNLACQKGFMMPSHKGLTHILFKTGHGVPLAVPVQPTTENNWTKLRQSYGLPPIPPTTHAHPDAVKEVADLMKSRGFDKLVGYPPKD